MQDILSIVTTFGAIFSCFWAMKLEYRLRSPFLVFWIAQAYFFAIPHFVSVMLERGDYPELVLTKASVFALLFNLIYIFARIRLVGRNHSAARKIRWKIQREFDSQSKRFFIALLLLWAIGASANLFVTLRYGVTGEIMDTTWAGRREAASILLLPCSYLLIAGTSSFILVVQKKKSILVLLLITANGLFFLFMRSRALMIPFFMPLFLYGLYGIGGRRRLLLVSALAFITLTCVYFLQQVRYKGSLSSWLASDQKEIALAAGKRFWGNEGEMGVREIWYYFIELDNNFAGFGQGRTYRRLALFMLPRAICPLKPPSFIQTMAVARHGFECGSVHPTLYGDAYANFEMFGFLVAFLYAVVAHLLDRLLSQLPCDLFYVFLGGLSSIFVLVPRGSIYNGFVQSIISCSLILIVYRILQRKRIPNRQHQVSDLIFKHIEFERDMPSLRRSCSD